jgi:hypothetical protein
MLEQLKQVDASVIDELMEIKRDREMVAERLAKMNTEQGKVADVVYRRVKRDYESKATALEKKAAPLKDRARQEYAKLKSLLDRIASQNSATKLDKEEVELRHRLGEFEDGEYKKRIAELEGKLDEQDGQLAETNELRDRFVEAFDSEAELAQPVAAPPPPAAAPAAPAGPVAVGAAAPAEASDAGITAPQQLLAPPAPPAAPPPSPPPPPARPIPAPDHLHDGTVILSPEGPPPMPKPAAAAPGAGAPAAGTSNAPAAAPAVASADIAGKTMVLSLARLVAIDPDLGAPEFPLQPLSFVGRTPDNQVRLNKPAVSRRHAQLTQTPKGWTIKDLQSENGTYVNGEKIAERTLADGDRVQIGTVRLMFKAG